jgi:hypothetical protein
MSMQKMSMTESLKTNINDEKRVKQPQQQQQQQQQHNPLSKKKKKKSFRTRQLKKHKPFDIGVLDLLTSLVYCYLTYFVFCISQKFVNFLSNEYYFVSFLILLLGIVVLQTKKIFQINI